MAPDNAYVKIGESVVFDCTVGDGGIQIWKEVNGTNETTVARNGVIEEGFVDVYETEGETNLRLISATLDKGLRYKCGTNLSDSVFSAQLIVLSKYLLRFQY